MSHDVIKNYEQFVEVGKKFFKEKIHTISQDREKGKLYEDQLSRLFDVGVVFPLRKKISDKSQIQYIADVISDEYIIDKELFDFMKNTKNNYIEQNPKPTTLPIREDYLNGDKSIQQYRVLAHAQGSQNNSETIRLLHQREQQLKQQYHAMKIAKSKEFQKRTKEVHDMVGRLKDIKIFAKLRVESYYENYKKHMQRDVEIVDQKIKQLSHILAHMAHNNRDRNLLQQELDEYTITQLELMEEINNYDNKEYMDSIIQTDTQEFLHKITQLAITYILSRNHSDEQLKKGYIEIFLWDKIKKFIHFDHKDRYEIIDGGKVSQNIQSTQHSLHKIIERYTRKYNNPPGKQLRIPFSDTDL